MVAALNGYGEAVGLPDVLGIQLAMPAREAHAQLQTQIPKNQIQVTSTDLPTIEKPVISSFQSLPKQTIMMGDEADHVKVDVRSSRISRRYGGWIASMTFPARAFRKPRCLPLCEENMERKR
jgi:hypothetical protein